MSEVTTGQQVDRRGAPVDEGLPPGWGQPSPPPPPPPPSGDAGRRSPGWRAVIATAVIAALVSAGVAVPLTRAELGANSQPTQTVRVEGGTSPVEAIAKAASPSVAQVDVTTAQGRGEGSAVIYRSDGYLITNNHVVDQAQHLTVTLPDGTSRDAQVVGADPTSDLAVIRIDATGLPVPAFARSEPQVGEEAVAIGSPFGLSGSVTAGIVSATGRGVDTPGAPLVDMIQTDAPINPGNSGGALVNENAEVIGINAAILSPTGANNGIGFAIPIQTARDVADQLIASGSVSHAFLGIQGQSIDPDIAQLYNLGASKGALIVSVVAEGPGDQAGLRRGDIVTAVDGQLVGSMADLAGGLRSHKPGDRVELTVVRQSGDQQVGVTLGEAPSQQQPG